MTSEAIIFREQNNSEISYELVERLKSVYNDNDFILAVLMYAKSEYDRKIILDFINSQNANDEQITLLALKLYQQHNNRT